MIRSTLAMALPFLIASALAGCAAYQLSLGITAEDPDTNTAATLQLETESRPTK